MKRTLLLCALGILCAATPGIGRPPRSWIDRQRPGRLTLSAMDEKEHRSEIVAVVIVAEGLLVTNQCLLKKCPLRIDDQASTGEDIR